MKSDDSPLPPHPRGTVPLIRYHLCRDPTQGEGTGFVTFTYGVGEDPGVVFPLFDGRHLSEVDPDSSDPRAKIFNRESQCPRDVKEASFIKEIFGDMSPFNSSYNASLILTTTKHKK